MDKTNNPVCFIITKIGKPSSEDSKESNEFCSFIKECLRNPNSSSHSTTDIENDYKIYNVIRVDKDPTVNDIIEKIFEHIIQSKLVIANLTPDKKTNPPSINANVMYEVALRHSLNLPIIHFIEKDYIDDIPFDIKHLHLITFDKENLEEAKQSLYEKLEVIFKSIVQFKFSELLHYYKGVSFFDIFHGHHFLINWEISKELETEAEKVYAITSNFNWTLSNIDSIIENIVHHVKNKGASKKHYYIFIRDECQNSENETEFNKRIEEYKETIKNQHEINLQEHIKVVSITKSQFTEAQNDKACEIKEIDNRRMLPKPVDIVLYIKTKDIEKRLGFRKYLVMSASPVPLNVVEDDLAKNYDVIFKDKEQIEIVEKWFKYLWKTFTGEDLRFN